MLARLPGVRRQHHWAQSRRAPAARLVPYYVTLAAVRTRGALAACLARRATHRESATRSSGGGGRRRRQVDEREARPRTRDRRGARPPSDRRELAAPGSSWRLRGGHVPRRSRVAPMLYRRDPSAMAAAAAMRRRGAGAVGSDGGVISTWTARWLFGSVRRVAWVIFGRFSIGHGGGRGSKESRSLVPMLQDKDHVSIKKYFPLVFA